MRLLKFGSIVAAIAAFTLPQAAVAFGYCYPQITEIMVNDDEPNAPTIEIYGKCFPDANLEVLFAEGQQGEFDTLIATRESSNKVVADLLGFPDPGDYLVKLKRVGRPHSLDWQLTVGAEGPEGPAGPPGPGIALGALAKVENCEETTFINANAGNIGPVAVCPGGVNPDNAKIALGGNCELKLNAAQQVAFQNVGMTFNGEIPKGYQCRMKNVSGVGDVVVEICATVLCYDPNFAPENDDS
ncbi:MAG: hypothetical protein WBG92_12040 [Thiohalocapsa sp.]